MAVVWIADIAAYFAGRRFGRHKLAPAISPGKTWEGVAGALAGVAVYASRWLLCAPAALAVAAFAIGAAAALAMLAMAACSRCCQSLGDLFESRDEAPGRRQGQRHAAARATAACSTASTR